MCGLQIWSDGSIWETDRSKGAGGSSEPSSLVVKVQKLTENCVGHYSVVSYAEIFVI